MLEINNELFMAEQRIRPYIRETALDFSLSLSKRTHTNVHLKWGVTLAYPKNVQSLNG